MAALLLLTVPTLFIGGLAVYLIRHEQDRLNSQATRDLQFKAAVLAADIGQGITAVRQGLLDRLAALPGEDPTLSLMAERRSNPLVRNVFVLDPDLGLLYPDRESPSSQEERDFLLRFNRLFREPASFVPEPVEAEPGSNSAQKYKILGGSQFSNRSQPIPEPVKKQGWKPWFWEDALHFLGWQELEDGRIIGVELEMVYLMAELYPLLNDFPSDNGQMALMDHLGNPFFRSLATDLPTESPHIMRYPVGPVLPHWEIWTLPQDFGSSKFFLISMTAIILLMVAAIVLAALSLSKQAKRHFLDAQRKTHFVTNVSHELKTPLTSIRLYAELLSGNRVPDPDKRQRYLGVIAGESQRLTRLVNNVLAFGRLERQATNLNLTSVDLIPLMERTLEGLRPRLDKQDVTLQTQFPAKPLPVMVDRDALEQVLLNLLDNALKYGQPKDASKRQIWVDCKTETHQVRIEIRDNGPGVPKRHRQRIFEKFFRVDQTLTSKQTGSGIGLSIARLLVGQMGGKLIYGEKHRQGGCFVITLPLAAAEEAP